jgi:hypothetical protein
MAVVKLLPFRLTSGCDGAVNHSQCHYLAEVLLQVCSVHGQALAAPEAVLPQPRDMVQEPLCPPDPGESAAEAGRPATPADSSRCIEPGSGLHQ